MSGVLPLIACATCTWFSRTAIDNTAGQSVTFNLPDALTVNEDTEACFTVPVDSNIETVTLPMAASPDLAFSSVDFYLYAMSDRGNNAATLKQSYTGAGTLTTTPQYISVDFQQDNGFTSGTSYCLLPVVLASGVSQAFLWPSLPTGTTFGNAGYTYVASQSTANTPVSYNVQLGMQLLLNESYPASSPSPSPSYSSTPSYSGSATPSGSITNSISTTPSYSPSASISTSASPTAVSISNTASYSASASYTTTASLSISTTPSISPTQSESISPSYSGSETASTSWTATVSTSGSPSTSESPTTSISASPSYTSSLSGSQSASYSPSYSTSVSASESVSASASFSGTTSHSSSASGSATPSYSPSASSSISNAATVSASGSESYTTSSSPSLSSTESITPSASLGASQSSTYSATASASATASSSATGAATGSYTTSAGPSETPFPSPSTTSAASGSSTGTSSLTPSSSGTGSGSKSTSPTPSITRSASKSPFPSLSSTASISISTSPTPTPTTSNTSVIGAGAAGPTVIVVDKSASFQDGFAIGFSSAALLALLVGFGVYRWMKRAANKPYVMPPVQPKTLQHMEIFRHPSARSRVEKGVSVTRDAPRMPINQKLIVRTPPGSVRVNMVPSRRNDAGQYAPPIHAVSTADVFLNPGEEMGHTPRLQRTTSNGSQRSQTRSPLPRVPSQGSLRSPSGVRNTPPSQFPSQIPSASSRGNFANPLSAGGGTPYRTAAMPPFVAQVYGDGDTFEYSRPPETRQPYTSPIGRGGPRMDTSGRTPSFRDARPARPQSGLGARYPVESGGERRGEGRGEGRGGDGRGPPDHSLLQRSPSGRMYPSNIAPPPGLSAPPGSVLQLQQARQGSMRSPLPTTGRAAR